MATIEKRQRKNGVRYRVKIRKAGQDVTRTFHTLAAAEAWASKTETAINEGDVAVNRRPSRKPLGDVIDRFIEIRELVKRPVQGSHLHTLQKLKRAFGDRQAATLTPQFWRERSLARLNDPKRPVSAATIAMELAYAAQALRTVAEEDSIMLPHEAPVRARARLAQSVSVTGEKRERRATPAELKRLFDYFAERAAVSKIPMRDLVEFALASGFRLGEILAIERGDVDRERRVVRLKVKHPRRRDLTREAPLLRGKETGYDALAIIDRQPKPEGEPRVFPYKGDSVSHYFMWAVDELGIEDLTFHDLRHEALSRCAEAGFDVFRLKLVGGHRDLRHLARYTNLRAEDLSRAAPTPPEPPTDSGPTSAAAPGSNVIELRRARTKRAE